MVEENFPNSRRELRAGTDLENRFTYHPPKADQSGRYDALRKKALEMALLFDKYCPDSREKSLAIIKLEEAICWANASIARNE